MGDQVSASPRNTQAVAEGSWAWMQTPDVMDAVARVRPFTMVPSEWLVELSWQVRAVLAENIPGDFVECGVWRGGASFLMADVLRQDKAQNRSVWLFDSFEGMPPPDVIDGPAAMRWARDTDSPAYLDNIRASLEEVRAGAETLGVAPYLRFVKGWFEETLPAHRDRIGPITILRIDCDWYASVRCCLENLYDSVVDGGFIIFDDYYTNDGCAIAVHEFLGARSLPYRIETVGGHALDTEPCAVFRKGPDTWRAARRNLGWFQWLWQAGEELKTFVPPGDTFILVDEDSWGTNDVFHGRRRIPFLERAGRYWGAPADDATAIRELERVRCSGATFLVVAWPAFWWFSYYAGFHRHVRSSSRSLLENERLMIFDLRARC